MHDNPHDAFFKLVFADPEHAAGELRSVLPSEVAAHVQWASLKPLPGSFVDEELARSHTDLLFSAQVAGHEALVYFLFEHLSTAPHLVPFRLLSYEVRIWQDFLAKHPKAKKLPVILPIVLHHSEQGWRAAASFDEVLDVAPALRDVLAPFVVRFRLLLDDVSHATDQDLRRRSMTALGKLALACFRDVRRPAVLLANLARWSDLFAEVLGARNGLAAAGAVLKYIAAACRRLPKEEIRKAMKQLGATPLEEFNEAMGDVVVEYFMDEGIARGRDEGRKEGRKEGRQEGRQEVLLLLLRERFGDLPESAVARIHAAGIGELDTWTVRMLRASTLDEVFAGA